MKKLHESVNVSTYVSVNFKERQESFTFSIAFGARYLNRTDLVSAGWFRIHTRTYIPYDRSIHTHTHSG